VKHGFATALVLLLISWNTAACGSKVYYVNLRENWPTHAVGFENSTQRWTRSGQLMSGFDQVLRVHATFKSPEWRAAYVAERTERQQLREKDRRRLLAENKVAAAKYYEVELLVSTYAQNENDLSRGKNSMWSLWLIDGHGNQVVPGWIKKDKRPRGVLREYFPRLGDFDVPYIVRFPRTVELLKPGNGQFSLRISSAYGALELVWLEKK